MVEKDVTDLNKKNFNEFIKKGKTIVDFWAPWCGPCLMMAPLFEKTAEELIGKVKFGRVNINEATELAQKFEVKSIPAMIIFKDGKQIDRVVGIIEKGEMNKFIEKAK